MANEMHLAPTKFDDDGRYTTKYLEWLRDACQRCTVDGEDGSCLIGLDHCKWT